MTDDELAGRFHGIDGRFEAVDRQFDVVDRRFDAVDQRLDAIDQRFEAVDRRFDGVDRRLEAIDQRFEQVFATIREEGAVTRRHMDVIAEGLRSEIKVIAEGRGVLTDRMAAMTSRQDRADARVERLEDRQLAHEHRLRKLDQAEE